MLCDVWQRVMSRGRAGPALAMMIGECGDCNGVVVFVFEVCRKQRAETREHASIRVVSYIAFFAQLSTILLRPLPLP